MNALSLVSKPKRFMLTRNVVSIQASRKAAQPYSTTVRNGVCFMKAPLVEGLLRLMVSDPLVMNLSNTLGYLRGKMGQEKVEKKSTSIWQFAPIKKVLLAVYSWIFKRYYG